MDLKSRLSTLQAQTGMLPSIPATVDSDDQKKSNAKKNTQNKLARLRVDRASGQIQPEGIKLDETALAKTLNATIVSPGLLKVERRIALTQTHGDTELAHLRATVALPGDDDNLHRRKVYIDTETTGLSGGSGTIVFLTGIAWVEDDHLISAQWLITRFSAEVAMLEALTQSLTDNDQLVSYNGKSFDLPLLITRCRMQAIRPTWQALPHLDLLHPVRRLFKHCWPDCKLITAEELLLHYYRTDDLPGAEAPQAWFDFVRFKLATRLIKIVEHNYWDVVSLAAVQGYLAHLTSHAPQADLNTAALGNWIANHNPKDAVHYLESLQQRNRESHTLLAMLYKRQGQWRKAEALWQQLAANDCNIALEELAKIEEHRHKNFAKALEYCSQLKRNEQTLKRIARLQTKLQRHQPAVSSSSPQAQLPF